MTEKGIQRKGVLAAGNLILDTIKIIDRWPAQDTLCSILSHSCSNGGGPYNILKNLSKLDTNLPLEVCGLVGDDVEGQWIIDDCVKAGIDVRQLRRHQNASTSTTDAMTDATTGRRTFFHQRGANSELDMTDFEFSKTKAKIFSLGYLFLLDKLDILDDEGSTGAATVLKTARDAGLITAVDSVSFACADFREIAIASLKQADIFFVNELEAGWIVNYEVTLKNMKRAVRDLARLGSKGVVVLHMPQAAVACSAADDKIYFQPSVDLPDEQIIGSNGAGDAFASGYLYAVHEGMPVKDCLNYAVCTAAMSLSHSTPSDGLKSVLDCLHLGELHGYKKLPNCETTPSVTS